jgi:hypothetical protein
LGRSTTDRSVAAELAAGADDSPQAHTKHKTRLHFVNQVAAALPFSQQLNMTPFQELFLCPPLLSVPAAFIPPIFAQIGLFLALAPANPGSQGGLPLITDGFPRATRPRIEGCELGITI